MENESTMRQLVKNMKKLLKKYKIKNNFDFIDSFNDFHGRESIISDALYHSLISLNHTKKFLYSPNLFPAGRFILRVKNPNKHDTSYLDFDLRYEVDKFEKYLKEFDKYKNIHNTIFKKDTIYAIQLEDFLGNLLNIKNFNVNDDVVDKIFELDLKNKIFKNQKETHSVENFLEYNADTIIFTLKNNGIYFYTIDKIKNIVYGPSNEYYNYW